MSFSEYPAFLEAAFLPGYEREEEEGLLRFYPAGVGELRVAEGRITAGDPFTYAPGEDGAFTVTFPSGRFPVELAVAQIGEDERIALARIRFSAQVPVRWELALGAGQDPAERGADDIFGYGVDSGTGAFFDAAGGRALAALSDAELDQLLAEFEENYRHTRSWLLWQRADATVALFSSGEGDGLYASYIGYAAGGVICRLLTDFGLLAWPSQEPDEGEPA